MEIGEGVALARIERGDQSGMTERRERVEDLYLSALEQDGPERGKYLEDACAGDEELRKEVESLPQHHEASQQYLEGPALDAVARTLAREGGDSLPASSLKPSNLISKL